MRWLPWRRKENPVAHTIYAGLGLGHIAFPKFERAQYVRDGFTANVTVYSAITQKGRAGAGIPWCLYKRPRTGGRPTKLMSAALAATALRTGHPLAKKAVETAEIDNHPLLTLLERPNPLQGGAEFHEARIAHLNIHGNSYLTGAGPGFEKGAPPRELWLMRPDRVTVVPHPVDMVAGYLYEVGGSKQPFARERVLHCRLFAADDDFYGMSPLRAAMRHILTVNEAVRWNYALLKNGARPPAAIIAQTGVTRDSLQDLRADIDELYSGAENAGRPILLEGTMDIKNIGFAPAEMEWLEGVQHEERKIAQALTMPPELIGDGENKTYANYKEARKAWYMEDVLPQADKDRDAFNTWLTPRYGDGLYLDYDRDQIEALQEEQAALWSRVERSTVLTLNEKRAALGYDTVPGGDQLLVPAAVVSLSDIRR